METEWKQQPKMHGSQTERHIASFCYHMHKYGAIHKKSHVARKKKISSDASFETQPIFMRLTFTGHVYGRLNYKHEIVKKVCVSCIVIRHWKKYAVVVKYFQL